MRHPDALTTRAGRAYFWCDEARIRTEAPDGSGPQGGGRAPRGENLGLDQLTTGGLSGLTDPPLQDNIIDDLDANGVSTGGFGHTVCGFGEEAIAPNLPPTQ
jgi:hypothetical protein